jgi:hypothetical protein
MSCETLLLNHQAVSQRATGTSGASYLVTHNREPELLVQTGSLSGLLTDEIEISSFPSLHSVQVLHTKNFTRAISISIASSKLFLYDRLVVFVFSRPPYNAQKFRVVVASA